MTPCLLKYLLNLYPPYLGTGISVKTISPDYKNISVTMALRWYNRNYVRSHFGGSLYAMTDPFLMLMLLNILGKEYHVWDKSAAIEFIRPGTGTVRADFSITDDIVADIIEKTADGEKYFPRFTVEILAPDNTIVARVNKELYVRRKHR